MISSILPFMAFAWVAALLFEDLQIVLAYHVACCVCWIVAKLVFGFDDYK